MHLTELCSYAICAYAELLLIEIAYLQSGPAYSYAVKRIMQLSDMHLSGVHCTQGLSKILRAPIYRAHHAVIFAVAQPSCNKLLATLYVCYYKVVLEEYRSKKAVKYIL